MIKSYNGNVTLEGSESEIRADLCIAIKAVREDFLQGKRGYEKKKAEAVIAKLIEYSMKDDAEIEKEFDKQMKKILLETVAEFFHGDR